MLFINDIVAQLGDDVFTALFADDLKIAKVINSPMDTEILQLTIDRLNQWCNTNDLHLNLNKYVVLTITSKRNAIQAVYTYGTHTFDRVEEHKDLGVLIDSKLNFIKHIQTITSKATAALGFLKRVCYDLND